MATALNLGNANGKTITLRNPDTNNSDITVEMDKVVVKDSNGQSTLGSIKLVGETKSHILSTDTNVGGTNEFRISRYSNSGVFEAVPFNIDTAGNVGIGVIPSAWGSSLKALDIGYGTAVATMTSYVSSVFAANCYYNGGWKYKNNEVASVYESNGTHMWKTAPSGTAGNAITWTQAMTLDASGYLYFGGDLADATTTGIKRGSAGQLILRASASGLYHQSTSSYYLVTTSGGSTSDINLKDNINTMTGSLAKICSIRGVTYTFKDEQLSVSEQGTQIGVIAQEVEEQFPEIVLTNENGNKTVRYDRLVAPLIEAIKEQQEIINDLKTRLEILEGGE